MTFFSQITLDGPSNDAPMGQARTQANKVQINRADFWSQEAVAQLPSTAQLGWALAAFPLVLGAAGLLLKLL